jgi:hypothetical protein
MDVGHDCLELETPVHPRTAKAAGPRSLKERRARFVPASPDNRNPDQTVLNPLFEHGSKPPSTRRRLQRSSVGLKSDRLLETAAGKKLALSAERLELEPSAIGGWIRHHGWMLRTDPHARLAWPIYPHNPYTNSPEKNPGNAVGALSVPLELKQQPERDIRPGEQEVNFSVQVD